MLRVQRVSKRFGGLQALDNVSLDIPKGEMYGLIGPNGSGKTTLLNVISGIYKVDSGSIYLKDEQISKLRPNEIAMKGIGRTFQLTKLFRNMSVLENMIVPGVATKSYQTVKLAEEKALELLKIMQIDHLKNEYAKNLSGGQQKLLEFARVLMMNPKVILMDEPFVGVNPVIKDELQRVVDAMNKNGLTFLIVSHDVPSVMRSCRRLTVLAAGKVIAEGDVNDIRKNDAVIEAYLGVQ